MKQKKQMRILKFQDFRIGWNNELHTGNMHLAFERPDLFENNDIHLRPISNQHLELVQGLIL